MTPAERNRCLDELADILWRRHHPQAARALADMDERSVSDYYAMANEALTYCEGKLVQHGATCGPDCGDDERLAGVGLDPVSPSLGTECAPGEPEESAAEASRLESGHQHSPFDDAAAARAETQAALAPDDAELDGSIPF